MDRRVYLQGEASIIELDGIIVAEVTPDTDLGDPDRVAAFLATAISRYNARRIMPKHIATEITNVAPMVGPITQKQK